jgi:hypothetical protein
MSTLALPAPLPTVQPTQHAMLVVWGHFAQTLPLFSLLAAVPVAEKTVQHTPQAKLLTLLLGILVGSEHLRDLSAGATPLCRDPAVAAAWGLPTLPSASSVSRTLSACDAASLLALQTALDTLAAPFLRRALWDLRTRQQPLQLDVDLTGRPVSNSSQTYPGAAFGYMDGQVRLGYQVATVCLQTALFGRQWLAGQQYPGDTVSTACLASLIQAAETRLGCHPRRRTELVAARITAQQALITAATQRMSALAEQARGLGREREQTRRDLQASQRRVTILQDGPDAAQHARPFGALTQQLRRVQHLERRVAGLLAQQQKVVRQQRQAQAALGAARAALAPLSARLGQLAAENTSQPDAPRCGLRMDAGFCSGENLTLALELGYDLLTKAAHPAVARVLQERTGPPTIWTRVGRNAEMVGWTNHYLRTCPYPLAAALERFHTPRGLKYSVLLHSQDDPAAPCPDLCEWFSRYNARQTIEAGHKTSKTVFKVQHLWSHSVVGMQMQVALTLFAANFVAWTQEWVAERAITLQASVARALQGTKYLVRVAANSPATVEQAQGQVVVRFSPLSGLAGTVIHLAGPQPVQLALDLYGGAHF